MKRLFVIALLLSFSTSVVAQTDEEAVNKVLDNIHKYASEANFEGYFDLYTEGAIFLGTDATERWTISEFKGYARPAFDRGSGWTYVMTERNIYLSPDGNTAWFDERLDNEGFGECRGTGALVKIEGEWKVSQYNLTVPVPNALLRQVVGMIRAGEMDQ
jgi:hypothetical protein